MCLEFCLRSAFHNSDLHHNLIYCELLIVYFIFFCSIIYLTLPSISFHVYSFFTNFNYLFLPFCLLNASLTSVNRISLGGKEQLN